MKTTITNLKIPLLVFTFLLFFTIKANSQTIVYDDVTTSGIFFQGTNGAEVANPVSDSVNSSTTVARSASDGNWQQIQYFPIYTPVSNDKLFFSVYNPSNVGPGQIQFEYSSGGGWQFVVNQTYEASSITGWVEYSVDLSSHIGNEVNKIIFMPAGNNSDAVYVDNVYFGQSSILNLPNTISWDGSESTDWATAANWDSNVVPTSGDNVVIADVTNKPIISSSTIAETNDLTIDGSATLTINNNGILRVYGTSTGNVSYNRSLGTENWYLVSAPVSGQAYNDAYVTANSFALGTGDNRGIASYLTETNTWSYLQAAGSGTFANGTGYSVKRASAGDISFTGTINTTDVSVAVANTGTGFNLLGNPFTSYVNTVPFINDNSANIVGNQIWVYNQATSNYEVKNLASEFDLAPTQGFFVRANANTNLNIAETYQVATGDAFQKTSRTEITLNMNDGSFDRFAKIYYLENATTGFDNGYDGETFGGIANSVDVFTHLVANSEGKKFQIQSLPNSDFETIIIPVGVKVSAGKEITFSVETMNIPDGINVYLEDKATNTVTLLSETNATYKVTVSENLDGIGRFYLHTNASGVLNTADIALENISIYSPTNSTLRIAGLTQGKASVKIYSLLGKKVFSNSFTSSGVVDLNLPKLATGLYVVQLETEKGKLNKKITLE